MVGARRIELTVGSPAGGLSDKSGRIGNLVAGLSVAGLLIPESIAYAGIAGIASQHAVVASVAGLMAYACIGGSRFAIVTPTSSSAAILAAAVATLAASGSTVSDALVLSGSIVLLVGVLFALAVEERIIG